MHRLLLEDTKLDEHRPSNPAVYFENNALFGLETGEIARGRGLNSMCPYRVWGHLLPLNCTTLFCHRVIFFLTSFFRLLFVGEKTPPGFA